jgi:L-lysine exporter family protein LysE/ArgO
MLAACLTGLLTSLSLILAIGAQNAFVLRQGLRREFVTPIVTVCAISDATLIALGVGGFTILGPLLPWLTEVMRWAGVAFLLVYGAMRFCAAWRGGETLLPANAPPVSLGRVLGTCLVITWANPHVYLDTLMLIGSISGQYHPYEFAFGIGAALGSFIFFASLGYGARLLAPILASVRSWIILECLIGLTMWGIAFGLIVKA